MALQIRRGTDTQRQALSGPNTPIAGELLYNTDNKKLYIGDGTTTGGTSIGYFGSVAVSGQSTIRSTGINEALTIVAGANISLITDANTGTLTIAAAPQELTNGSLRLFQNNITSLNSNEDINIDPAGTGKVNVVGNLTATTLTGALTGNVTGNVTGNTAGTHTGSVVGDVTGNVSGNAGTVTNGFYTSSSFNLGTSSVAINRASGSQSLTGINIDGSAGAVAVAANNAINATNYPLFVSSATGNLTPTTDTNFSYNPFSNTLTAGFFNGSFNNQRISINQNIISSLSSNENIEFDLSGTGQIVARTSIIANGIGLNLNPANSGILITSSMANRSTFATFHTTDNASLSTPFVADAGLLTGFGTSIQGAPFTFIRGRGTPLSPTTLLSGDEINVFDFIGIDQVSTSTSAKMKVIVDGTVATGKIPARFEFLTTNLAGTQAVRFTISSTAVTSTVPISNGSLQLFQNNLAGLNSNEDIVIAPAGTGGVKIDKVAAPTSTSTSASIGYLGVPVSTITGTGTLTLADAGKHVYINTTGQTITIPANGTVPYPIGTTIAFIAGPSATTVTIAIATDTMYLAGPGTTGSRTLAAFGMASAVKIGSTSWIINGAGLT